MLEGFRSDTPRENLPLTLMAESAVSGNSGCNLDGYRDYRGVQVVGAWIWDNQYDFGLAFEIDVEEAYRSFHYICFILILVVSVASILFIWFSVVLILRDRKMGIPSNEMLKLNNAIKQADDMIVVTDTEGIIEYVNPSFERHVGYNKD